MTTIRPDQLSSALDEAPHGIAILSLDCFDTLLWRATHLPQDVFAGFGDPGGGIEPRVRAEAKARLTKYRSTGVTEVSIEEIHARGCDDPADRVARELALEAHYCFAFAPTVALMKAAKAKGLTVIVVSDTYLSRDQLAALILAAAGPDVAGLIDRIFCSSDHGRAKADGLFPIVLDALKADPATILHIGDNPVADHTAALAAGLHAVHIRQFDDAAQRVLRLEAAAAVMTDQTTRIARPVVQLHRAAVALTPFDDATQRLGHRVFGPVVDAFARWVADEVDALARSGDRPVKTLFLLRDGHLPHLAYEAIGRTGAAVSISRFTARRASFVDADSIGRYLDEDATLRLDVLAAQLGLTAREAHAIGADPAAFRRNVLAPERVERIVARSARFAKRLTTHLERQGGVEKGDLIVFVDLGYHGTVQDLVAPLLERAMGVAVTGRYLLLTDETDASGSKRGLFDRRHYHHRVLGALTRNIAVVEQVATTGAGSVVDYGENGRSIHKPNRLGEQQKARGEIQAGAIGYVRRAAAAVHRAPAADDGDGRRRTAMAVLGRLLFLPQREEVAVFERFVHDVNLGTDDRVGLIDPQSAAVGLRRYGMPYLQHVDRMFPAGELQPHGLPLNLAYFTAGCLGLDLRVGDFAATTLAVPLFLMNARGHADVTVDAVATHDGFYAATIPVGEGGLTIGVQIGRIADIVQIDHVAFYRSRDPAATDGAARTPIAAVPVFDAMEPIATGLWQCGPSSMVVVPPAAVTAASDLVLSVVFRVVVRRGDERAVRLAA